MKVTETTPPVERTFDMIGLTLKELSVIRKALSDYEVAMRDDRMAQDDLIACKLREENNGELPMDFECQPPYEEEALATNMVSSIRAMERSGLVPKAPQPFRPQA